MKKVLAFLLLYPLAVFCFAAAFTIDWGKPTTLQISRVNSGDKIEFGLRSDGIVVWRQILPAKPTTNSPAEKLELLDPVLNP